MENIEIEIKIKISDETANCCKNFLAHNARFVNSSQEVDQYLGPSHRNFLAPEFPYEWLRLRLKNNKVVLNYKHWYPENAEVSTHCDEFETEIQNSDSLLKIFKALDITPLIIVDKVREKYNYKDEFDISIDFIKELGYFIEIEYIGKSNVIEEANKLVLEIAKTLNLDLSQRDNRGYPYLMLEKVGQLKNYKNDK
jgi:predicted adenylyl cyclase CyaB